MLENEYPENDEKGMTDLARSLFHVGDRRNAGGILAVLFAPFLIEDDSREHDSREAPRAEGETSDEIY
jgi:hypothetical protein